jgi:hypothetical protein
LFQLARQGPFTITCGLPPANGRVSTTPNGLTAPPQPIAARIVLPSRLRPCEAAAAERDPARAPRRQRRAVIAGHSACPAGAGVEDLEVAPRLVDAIEGDPAPVGREARVADADDPRAVQPAERMRAAGLDVDENERRCLDDRDLARGR